MVRTPANAASTLPLEPHDRDDESFFVPEEPASPDSAVVPKPPLDGRLARARRRDPLDMGELVRTRRPPPTREEEVELAQRIERATNLLIDALVASPVALGELRRIAEELAEGSSDALELTTALPQEQNDAEQVGETVVQAIERLQSSSKRSPGRDAARAAVIDLLVQYGVSHKAVDRVLAKLRAECERGARGRKSLEATIGRITKSRTELERAKSTLVEANLGLVFWMVMKRGKTLLPLPDLVQEGTLGLMRAVDKFDYRRGVRFNTYATWWIRHAINRALSDQSRTIRVPVHLLETRHTLSRLAQEFSHASGRAPTDVELSAASGLPIEKVRAATSITPEPVSMDAPVGPDTDVRLGDVLADDRETSTVDSISADQLVRRMRVLIGTLSPREQEILRLRFGIGDGERLTFQEIGEKMSLSRERIRQIEVDALAKLRRQASAEGLDAHLLG